MEPSTIVYRSLLFFFLVFALHSECQGSIAKSRSGAEDGKNPVSTNNMSDRLEKVLFKALNSKNFSEQVEFVKNRLVKYWEKRDVTGRDGGFFGLGGIEEVLFIFIIFLLLIQFIPLLGGGLGGYGHGHHHHPGGHIVHGRKKRGTLSQDLLSTIASRVISAIERPY